MPFPEAPRVIYEKNPLETVICQLQFPAVLKISAAPPVAFQDSVRRAYPLFKEKPPLDIAGGLPPEIANLIAKGLPFSTASTAYDFTSADEKWTLSLSRDFLALTTSRYERWEAFREHLDGALRALMEHYSPAFFTRVGLRYRDIIRRSALGLEGKDWKELLRSHIAGALASTDVAAEVEHTGHEILMRLPDGQSHVLAHHGLVQDAGTKEVCYLIDCDFFLQRKTETTDALRRLNFLNHNGRLFFRWCITDRLHEAMGPRLVHGH
jgi:uncharacterized protein (TIGR04255 family)